MSFPSSRVMKPQQELVHCVASTVELSSSAAANNNPTTCVEMVCGVSEEVRRSE